MDFLKNIECLVFHRPNDGVVVVRAPRVGRVSLGIGADKKVDVGQSIGQIAILNRRYDLVVPAEASGLVTETFVKSNWQPVAYGDDLIALSAAHQKMSDKAGAKNKENKGTAFASPMDGMFYLRPSPGAPEFIRVGEVVKPGDTIGLIEVMKCFYPVKFDGKASFKVLEVRARDSSPLRAGDTIFVLGSN